MLWFVARTRAYLATLRKCAAFSRSATTLSGGLFGDLDEGLVGDLDEGSSLVAQACPAFLLTHLLFMVLLSLIHGPSSRERSSDLQSV